MGEGQETSERPASFHEHRTVWVILSGLIKSPSNPFIEIIMYNKMYTDVQQEQIPKEKNVACVQVKFDKLPIHCWINKGLLLNLKALKNTLV